MLFIADENFPLPSINKLRSAGHDVVAIITDSPGAADEEILTRAVRETRMEVVLEHRLTVVDRRQVRQRPLKA